MAPTGGGDWFEGSVADGCRDGTFVRCRFNWDSNDLFFVEGTPVTMEAFAAALSDGDIVSVVYDPAGTSSFDLLVDHGVYEDMPDPLFGLFVPTDECGLCSYVWDWEGNVQITTVGS